MMSFRGFEVCTQTHKNSREVCLNRAQDFRVIQGNEWSGLADNSDVATKTHVERANLGGFGSIIPAGDLQAVAKDDPKGNQCSPCVR